MRKKLLLAIALVGMSSAARADWQYTRWGMSLTQVIAASHGQVHEVPETDSGMLGRLLARGTYRAGGLTFNSTFFFDDSGLSRVHLSVTGVDCKSILTDLIKKYGMPSVNRIGEPTWRDGDNANVVHLTDAGSVCVVSYTPGTPSAASGL